MVVELTIIANYYCVSIDQIKGNSRKGVLPEARKMACYLLRVLYKEPVIAKSLNLNRSTVNRAIQDMRFFVNTYPILRQKATLMEQLITLQKQANDIENWLKANFEKEPLVVFEKQKQLELINQKLTLCQQN